MICNILQLIFCAILFAVPMALYKSNRTFMARFYNAMVYREKARRLYVRILLILLLLFHYVYACGHVGEFGILLSTAVCAAIYSFRRTDRWLRRLPGRTSSFVALATTVLVIGFVPHLYTLAVTVAFLLLAALFYPSDRVMTESGDLDRITGWMQHPALLAESYHDYHHARLPQDADSGNTDISAQ